MDFLKSSISGIKWISISRFGRQFIQLITVVFVANLLSPKDFGLMATALIFINFINAFRDFGIGQAIIQYQNFTTDFFSSLYWMSVILGSLIIIVIFLLSDHIALLLVQTSSEAEIVSQILKVLAVGFFFNSIISIHLSTLEKLFSFSLIGPTELFGTFIGAVVGIGMAATGFGVWSLVFQSMAEIIFLFVILSFLSPYKPRLYFNLEDVKEVLSFSANLLGFNVVNYLARNFDYLLVSKLFGTTPLGYYSLAYRIMFYPIENITNVISRVVYPVYSKIQNDHEKFKEIYKKVAVIILSITLPLIIGLMITSNEFVEVFFGSKWMPMIPILLLLSPVAILQSVATTTGSIYKAKGRTDIMFKWGLLNSTIVVIAFSIGSMFGVNGVAGGYLIANILLFYFWLAIAFKLINLPVVEFFHDIKQVAVPAILLTVVLLVLKPLFNNYLDLYQNLFLSIIIGASVYIISYYYLNKSQLIYYWKLIRNKEVKQ